MEIKITKNTGKLSLLSRITFILIGVMFTSIIFSIGIKHLHTYGIYLGLLIAIPCSYFAFKKTKAGSKRRMLTWGLVVMTSMMIITYIAFLISIASIKL